MPKIERVSTKALTWIDITHPTRKDLDFLKQKFKFAEEDIADSLPSKHAQRPRVSATNNYIFIVVLFPVFNKETRTVEAAEVDVFVTADHLITIHDQKVKLLNSFFNDLNKDPEQRAAHLTDKPSFLFYEILDMLYHNIFPMLDNINRDINRIENTIFEGKDRKIIREILVVKSNILNFKRIMQAHRSMIKKLLTREFKFFGSTQFVQLYYNELFSHVKDIWTILETYGESIESLENTNNAIIEQNMNRIITTLTILTMLIFPFSILGGIFGMNALHIPIIGNPFDFWIILGLMTGTTFVMYIIFKRKGWI